MRTAIHAVRRRQHGATLLHALVFTAGIAVGWLSWDSESTTPATAVENPSVATNRVPAAPAPADGSNTNAARQPALPEPAATTNRAASDFVPVVRPAVSRARPRETAGATPGSPSPSPSLPSRNTSGGRSIELTNASRPRDVPVDKILECQIGLVRQGLSPGSIDGVMGGQTLAAVRAFQQREGLPVTGQIDAATLVRLTPEPPLYTNYIVTAQDLERLLPLGKTWLAKSQQPRLDFETILELIAEQTLSNPKLVRRLNPSIDWTNVVAGTEIKVVHVQYPEPAGKAAFVRITISERTLQVFGAESNLLAHFPCSIAQRVEKRPVGEELHITVTASDPNYTFDPAVFPESAEARELGRKLILQPGPNNPVGAVWIGLDKSGYGIHGTPRPEEVGRTESHGCFRLANWNARYLLQFVTVGTPIEVLP